MRCEDLEERAERFLDGELPAPEAEAVRAHLAGCRACRERLAVFAALGSEIAALAEVEPAGAGEPRHPSQPPSPRPPPGGREGPARASPTRRLAARRLLYALAAVALAGSATVSVLSILARREAIGRSDALAAAERVLEGVLAGGVTPDEVGERRLEVDVSGRPVTVLVRVTGGPGLYEVRTIVAGRPGRASGDAEGIEVAALGIGAGAGGRGPGGSP